MRGMRHRGKVNHRPRLISNNQLPSHDPKQVRLRLVVMQEQDSKIPLYLTVRHLPAHGPRPERDNRHMRRQGSGRAVHDSGANGRWLGLVLKINPTLCQLFRSDVYRLAPER